MAPTVLQRDHRDITDRLRPQPPPPDPDRHAPGHGRRAPQWTRGPRDHGPIRRRHQDRLLGGVASAIAARTGWDVTAVRIGLVLCGLASGVGVAGYVVAWLVLPLEGEPGTIATRALADARGLALAVAVVPVLVVALLVASALHAGWLGSLAWPLLVSVAGLVLVWRNASEDERTRLRRAATPLTEMGAGISRSGKGLAARVVVALALALGGVGVLAARRDDLFRPLAGIVLVLAAFVVVFGPWWLRLARQVVLERQARLQAEDRADLAARVHDSVLQTLTMIQHHADDPQRVAQLARSQERELRSWLFEGRRPASFDAGLVTVAAVLAGIQRDVEATHGLRVEVVVVGDCTLSDDLETLLAAGREATVNAARWSGADVVSLFAEIEPDRVSLYVRDRGRGFDRATVPGDRRGIAESIEGRMARCGGRAVIRTAPGAGTEIELGVSRRTPTPAVGGGRPVGPAAATGDGRPRVFLVDDHHLFRSGVRSELGDAVEVVGEADDVAPAIELIVERRPDVVLLDVHLPSGGGRAVVDAVKRIDPDVRFLALSVSDAPEDVIGVIRAGARGYVTKAISGADLVDAVRRVAGGDAVFSPRLAGFVLDAFAAMPGGVAPPIDPELDQLSPREREVLRLIARGYTYREVGVELSIAPKTVESHVSAVLRKLQLSTRHQLTRWAAERRLV